jgi:hypothetical protein
MPTSSTVWCWSTWKSPVGATVEVDQAVAAEQVEHVVEEPDAGADR